LHTGLAASGGHLVHESVGSVVDLGVQIAVAALVWVHHLAEVGSLATFDVVDVDDWSGETHESAGAWSFDLEEWLVVNLLVVVSELDVEDEWSAGTTEEKSGAEVGGFSSSEELDTGLFTRLVDGEDGVAVLTFAATGDFSDVDLLLDEDAIFVDSFEAREGLARSLELWLLLLLWRIAALLWRIATLLWRIATLLWGILLWGIATLLRRVSTLLLRKHGDGRKGI